MFMLIPDYRCPTWFHIFLTRAVMSGSNLDLMKSWYPNLMNVPGYCGNVEAQYGCYLCKWVLIAIISKWKLLLLKTYFICISFRFIPFHVNGCFKNVRTRPLKKLKLTHLISNQRLIAKGHWGSLSRCWRKQVLNARARFKCQPVLISSRHNPVFIFRESLGQTLKRFCAIKKKKKTAECEHYLIKPVLK